MMRPLVALIAEMGINRIFITIIKQFCVYRVINQEDLGVPSEKFYLCKKQEGALIVGRKM